MNKIIAEIGSVHDGKLNLAFKLIRKAASSGADIIKFQMHISEYETLKNAPSPKYFNKEDRYSYFKRTSFDLLDWKKIKKYCEQNDTEFLCSPFSTEAVDLLEKLNVKYYKVPSGELTNLPLLEKLNKTGKKIILSTGMSNWKEIDNAVKIFNKKKIILLQCSSIYPCPLNRVGINVIKDFSKRYKCQVGFSDHTLGSSASFAAASVGASVIEKHFTLSRDMYGSDAKNSMEPEEFKLFSKTIKEIWHINQNNINKNNIKKFKDMKIIFEKSIYAKNDLQKGHRIRFSDLSFKKPCKYLRADKYKTLIGKVLVKTIKKDEPLHVKNVKK